MQRSRGRSSANCCQSLTVLDRELVLLFFRQRVVRLCGLRHPQFVDRACHVFLLLSQGRRARPSDHRRPDGGLWSSGRMPGTPAATAPVERARQAGEVDGAGGGRGSVVPSGSDPVVMRPGGGGGYTGVVCAGPVRVTQARVNGIASPTHKARRGPSQSSHRPGATRTPRAFRLPGNRRSGLLWTRCGRFAAASVMIVSTSSCAEPPRIVIARLPLGVQGSRGPGMLRRT